MAESLLGLTTIENSVPRILFVDDDTTLLETLSDQFNGNYLIHTAASGADGLHCAATQGPFAAIITDMQMPQMDGIGFLREVREVDTEAVRIMMTAHADLDTAVNAVNQGHIFRFVIKPFSRGTMEQVLRAATDQHKLILAERVLLEKTLTGSIQVLMDVLASVSPLAFGRASRLRHYAGQLARNLNLESIWEIELAALLSQLGCVAIPPETFTKAYVGEELSVDEKQSYARLPEISEKLILNIPRLEQVAQIISLQNEAGDPHTKAGGNSEAALPRQAAEILKLVTDFEAMLARGMTKSMAIGELKKHDCKYNPALLAALKNIEVVEVERKMLVVRVDHLDNSMVIGQDIQAKSGHLLVARGQQVNLAMRELLQSYADRGQIPDSVSVYVPTAPNPPEIAFHLSR